MFFNSPITSWHVVTFDNNNGCDVRLKLSMEFTDELFFAYMNNPYKQPNARYYYKHNDTQSIYYLSPGASLISSDILKKYRAETLLCEPDITGFYEHVF